MSEQREQVVENIMADLIDAYDLLQQSVIINGQFQRKLENLQKVLMDIQWAILNKLRSPVDANVTSVGSSSSIHR